MRNLILLFYKSNCFKTENFGITKTFFVFSVHNTDIPSKKCKELIKKSVENHLTEMKMSPQSGSSAQQQPNQQQATQQQHQQLSIQQPNINNQPMYQIPAYVATQGPHGGLYQMQMLPQSMGSNVYVSNVTANVNVHGYMATAHPQQMMTPTYLTPTEQQSQNSTSAVAGTIVHESHVSDYYLSGIVCNFCTKSALVIVVSLDIT
jgi:hypothetical protein